MKRKLIPLLLALALALACLAGCAGTEIQTYTPTDAPSPTPADGEETPIPTETVAKDYTAAYEAFAPDTLVMTIDGLPVTWQEYFYWMYSNVYAIEYYYGEITDWDAACAFDETQTYREFVQNYALDTLVQYRALESHANEMGVTLTEEDEAQLQEQRQSDIDAYGGGDEAAFQEYLDSLYVGQDLYDYINRMTCIYYNCFAEMYGGEGEKLSEADILEYGESAGYMTVKHILISTVDDAGESVTDEVKAEKLQQAQDLIAELQAASDLETAFDTKMNELSEDPGLAYYPGGYCFTEGRMYQAFEDASKALEPGQMTAEPVETTAGYHIILRLPLTPDDLVEYQSETEQTDLRYLAAVNMFDSNVGSWLDEAQVTYEPGFEDLNPAEIF
jgi:parvulin-like peptidyl-prolyl isomerase